jgi:predicted MFS family arabinose efflux permease
VLTLLAVAGQTVAVVGPTLGGALIEVSGWRATLAINIPLGMLSFIFGSMWLPTSRAPRSESNKPRIDVGGVVFFAAPLVALLI